MQKQVTNRGKRLVSLLMCICVLSMVIAMPIVAHAAGYKVVTDYTGTLNSQEIGKIEGYAGKLTQYDVAVYIGDIDAATGDAVNKVAVEQYGKIFGANDNGVLITIVFDEENYNTAVAVGDKLPLTGSQINQLSDMVFESYWDYESDAAWIEGSFKAVTEYIGNIEAKNPVQSEKPAATTPQSEKPAATTPQPEKNPSKENVEKPDVNKGDTEKKEKGGAGAIVFAVLSGIAAAGGVIGWASQNEKRKEKEAELQRVNANRSKLSADLDTANAQCAELREQIEGFKEWRAKVLDACPNINDMIKEHEAKQEAESFMEKYSCKTLDEGRDTGYYSILRSAFRNLSEAAMAFVPFNLETLKERYEKAKENEAKEEARRFMAKYPSIDVALSSSGYEEITKILEEYDDLSYIAKTHVTYSVDALRAKQEECAKAFAKEAEQKLQEIYDKYPDEMASKDRYDYGYSYYEGLPVMVRTHIPAPFWTRYVARRTHIHEVYHNHHYPPRRPEPPRPPAPPRYPEPYRAPAPHRHSDPPRTSGFVSNSGPSRRPEPERPSTPPRTSTTRSGSNNRSSSGSSFGSSFGTRSSSSRPSSTRRSSPPSRPSAPRTSTPRGGAGGRRR